ncbi:hypothetical protein [Pleionea sediminis]|uniref:hypothetical protein n=1 Tax=Pleionea sediminis TaxID=2569479 RepID=UPI0013DDEF42|nr:hypothetical protein [Pleionea sediminis]
MEQLFDVFLALLSLLLFLWGAMCFGLSMVNHRFRHRVVAIAGTTSVSLAMLVTLII